jgi:hypothetical protein
LEKTLNWNKATGSNQVRIKMRVNLTSKEIIPQKSQANLIELVIFEDIKSERISYSAKK